MFGNLFDEKEEFISQPTKKNVSKPLPRRPPSGLCGLKNQGATCYLNSLIQVLLFTPEFRDVLYKIQPQTSAETLNCLYSDKRKDVIKELQCLFGKLLLLNQNAVSTEDLTNSFGWNDKEVCEQHDIQELLRILLIVLENSVKEISTKSLFSNLYHGIIRYKIVCKKCANISRIFEEFMELHVHVVHSGNLEDALFKNFQVVEVLKNNSSYFCENCHCLVEARKTAKLRFLPPIMTINLLRFNYDRKSKKRYKETGEFRFPMHINLLQYCSEEVPANEANYELISVVVHKGNPYSGHYHAYIKDIDGWGKWTNQSKIRLLPLKNPLSMIVSLFSKSDQNPVPIKDIEELLAKHARISWKEQYEETFGSIPQFIKRYNEIFSYDQTHQTVSLLYKAADTTIPKDIFCIREEMNSHRPQYQPERGQAWFDFNDEIIEPITEKDLEKTFQGEESAYMLFYRQSQHILPLQASGNPAYGVPEHVKKYVSEEEEKLDKWREEYDESINQLTLEILLGSDYEYREGAIKSQREVDKLFVMADKRDTFGMFLHKVSMQLNGNNCVNNVPKNFHLHFISELPAGIHLMDRFIEDELQLLMFTKLKDKTKLFLWDGEMIGGRKEILVGPESQPVLLHIVIAKSEVFHEFSCGFAKNLTLMELKNKLLSYVDLEFSSLKMTWLAKQVCGKMLELNEYNHGITLAEIGVANGDQIIIEENSSNYAKELFNKLLEEETRKINIYIENHCENSDDTSWDWDEKLMALDKDQTIEELKIQIISKLDITTPSCGSHLRIDNVTTGLQPPLHGHLMVEEAGLYNGVRVVLESGPSPNPEEISLSIFVKDRKLFDIIINYNFTVEECLRIILNKAELQGQNWILRKMDWSGEPREFLDDSKVTLKKLNMKNGDQLLVEEQTSSSKDIISPAIWLYPRLYIGHHLLSKIHSANYIESKAKHESHKPVFLGNVEIYSTSTAVDLKKHLIRNCRQLLLVKNLSRIRLSIIENDCLVHILKDDCQILRKYKIMNSTNIACQILKNGENLRVDHLLLYLCEYMPESHNYKYPRDFVWDYSSSPSYSCFKKAVSKFLFIPPEQITFAKYFPETQEWLDINDYKEEIKKNSLNLRSSPYFLKDGDVIGYKIESHWSGLDNFAIDDSNRNQFKSLINSIGDSNR